MTTFQIISIAVTLIFVSLQIADIVTTYLALSKGHTEANPVLKRAFEIVGVLPALIGMKMVVIVLFAVCYAHIPMARIGILSAMGLVSIFYIWVVWNNVKILKG